MRRAELAKLTGLTPTFLNTLARRDQFPFLKVGSDKGGWGDYGPKHAFMTTLALGLANAGATQDEAGHFLEIEFSRLEKVGVSLGARSTADVYLGFVRIGSLEAADVATGRSALYLGAWPVCGSLGEVLEEVERLQVRTGKSGVHSVILVNASEQLRGLHDRAAQFDIDLGPPDPAPVPQRVSP